jgi:hypothetical protein
LGLTAAEVTADSHTFQPLQGGATSEKQTDLGHHGLFFFFLSTVLHHRLRRLRGLHATVQGRDQRTVCIYHRTLLAQKPTPPPVISSGRFERSEAGWNLVSVSLARESSVVYMYSQATSTE